jgi:hypothetical protein
LDPRVANWLPKFYGILSSALGPNQGRSAFISNLGQIENIFSISALTPCVKWVSYFDGDLNLNLISNFAQSNSKSHPTHPNVNKTHDEINIITILVQTMKKQGPQKSNEHKVLVTTPICNSLLIKIKTLTKKFICKYTKYKSKCCTNPLCDLSFMEAIMEKVLPQIHALKQ